MGVRPVKWTFSRTPTTAAPPAINEAFSTDQWEFIGWTDRQDIRGGEVNSAEATLAKTGDLALTLTPQADAGIPYVYSLEGDVEDVSRQHIANRSSLLVHPAPWYIGLKRPSYFVSQKNGVQTAIVAVGPDGKVVPGVTVDVKLTQVQWHSVRRSEGNGFYTWESERKDVDAGSWTITSAAEPVPLDIKLANGGYFVLEATAREAGTKRFTVTKTSFYALGDGYTAWARFDHNRIELVPEQQDLQARRHRADHDPVAVGAGDGARHGRTGRRAIASPVRADVDAAVDSGRDQRRGDSRTSSSRCCSSKGARRRRRQTTPSRARQVPIARARTSPRICRIPASRRSASATSS